MKHTKENSRGEDTQEGPSSLERRISGDWSEGMDQSQSSSPTVSPKLPLASLEQFADDIRRDPDSWDLRLAYAAVVRSLGHEAFARFIEEHIAYNQLAQEVTSANAVLKELGEHVEKLHDGVRREYFLPPNERDTLALCVRDGLQRDSHLVAHQGIGGFWIDPFACKEFDVQVFRCPRIIPFWECLPAIDLQPLCGLSLYRGFREVEILGRHGVLKYVSEIICDPKEPEYGILIKDISEVSRRVRALVLPAEPEAFNTLSALWPSANCPLGSVKFYTGRLSMGELSNQPWCKAVRTLEFRDLEFAWNVESSLYTDTFPMVSVLGFGGCKGAPEIIKEALRSGAFPKLAELRVDTEYVEDISRMLECKSVRVRSTRDYPLYGPFYQEF